MKVQVLGTGCMKCKKLYAQVNAAIADLGISVQLQKVEALDQIMQFGVPMTPALVINGEVKSAGKIPEVSEIAKWIAEANSGV